jgi:prefoldin subunit 5
MGYEEARELFRDGNLNEVVRKRIYELDTNFSDVYDRMNDIDKELTESISQTYDTLNRRIDLLEDDMREELQGELAGLREEIEALRGNMKEVNDGISENIDSLREDLTTDIENANERIDDVDDRIDEVDEQVRGDMDKRIDEMESKFAKSDKKGKEDK